MDKKVVAGIGAVSLLVIVVGMIIVTRGGNVVENSDNSDTNSQTSSRLDMKINESDWIKGAKQPKLTLVEYGDFQCPSCAAYYPVVEKLITDFPNDLQFVYRHYPLTQIHKNAYYAAKASQAAGKQGKFWEMHMKLFENQKSWGESSKAAEIIEQYAKDIGLDIKIFKADVTSLDQENKINADLRSGDEFKVTGTPTFFLNGVKLGMPGSYENFKSILEQELKQIPTPTPQPVGSEVHEHSDFALFVNGKKVDLSLATFNEKNEFIHIHDANGDVIHKHRSDANLGMFFNSLELKLNADRLYVNGAKYNGKWEDYVFQDLDRLALSNYELSSKESNLITDIACIYSEKCPERGTPPTENCVGGLNTPCEVKPTS